MTRDRSAEHGPASILWLPAEISRRLRYCRRWGFDERTTAAEVFEAIYAIRDGVRRPHSPFEVEGIGPAEYNTLVDWLAQCGYPTSGLKLP
jgi:hypothetical protein